VADFLGQYAQIDAPTGAPDSLLGSNALFQTLDHVAPTLWGLSPSVGSSLGRQQAISFNVSDNVAMAALVILVEYPQQPNGVIVKEVVWDGSFEAGFRGGANTSSIISGGYHFSILRDGGWPASSVTIRAVGADTSGNPLA
jgi:hypothetical protein